MTRLYITSLVSLLGVRRHADKVVDRICLSFYLADSHLNISDLAIKPADSYLVYWLATLAPIYDLNISKLFFENNIWIKKYLPNFYQPIINHRRTVVDNRLIKISKNFNKLLFDGKFGDMLEVLAKKIQSGKIKNYIGDSVDEPNTNVVINSEMLKFHKVDRREEYHNLWQLKINQLDVNE